MDAGAETARSAGLYGERGAGGKLRKPPSRKPNTTPYSRPPSNQAARGPRRWLSGIVDPAYRLISGGATRLFPSFFSKSNSVNALPPPIAQHHDEQHMETEQNAIADREDNSESNNGISIITEIAGPSKTADRLKSGSDFEGNKKGDRSEDIGLSEIEQLLKGKMFSRNEVNHLMEIIHSRAVELPNVDHKKEKQGFSAAEKAKWPVITDDIPKPSEEKQEDLNKAIWATSAPLPQSAMRDQVGASPVDIARAFMGSRTSEIDPSFKNAVSEDEMATLHGDEFSSKPFLPTPSKPLACWHGSMLQDQHDYSTPQTERGRFGLHNLPRTPYSRTIFSKSKSKLTQLQGGNDRTPITLYSPLKQSQTPIYGQPRGDTLDGGYGSAGPVRRLRHKTAAQSPATGSPYVHSSPFGPSRVENSSATKGFLPAAKNFELGGLSGNSQIQSSDRKSSSFGVRNVHPQSSLIARTILEHIDRNPPTLKDKSEELKLAFAWKKTPSSGVSSVIQNGHDSLPLGGFNSRKLINQDYKKNSAQNSLFKIPPVENTVKAITVANNIPAGDGRDGRSLSKSTNEDFPKIAPNVVGSGVLNQQNEPAFQSLEAKRAFPSISVDKPESKWAFSSGNSSGFTFPVSTSSVVFSEPPTPSFIPSSLASSQHKPKEEGDAIPTYVFGSKKSDPLVFAFPSTSAEVQNDASDIKFGFGSDKPKLSFGSIGKDAICY